LSSSPYKFLFLFILVFAVLGLVACTTTVQIPEDKYYRLPEARPLIPLDRPFVEGVLGVAPLNADSLHRERAIIYVDPEHPLQLNPYHYHFWVESPVYLIQEHLLTYFRAVGLATRVVRFEPGMRVDALVKGTLQRFERIVENNGIKVSVALELEFIDQHRRDTQSWSKEYSETEQAADATMDATIEAFGNALNRIYTEFTRDLTQGKMKQPKQSIK
jgi:ABC-type uncharacterized transport system auxiliary subunit